MRLKYSRKFICYIAFGGLNTAITFILYILLIKIGINYILASTLCYLIGIIEGFLFNAWFVFLHKPEIKGLGKYTLVYIVSYLINIGLLYSLVSYFTIPKIMAQFIAVVVITVINFKLVKLLVFKK